MEAHYMTAIDKLRAAFVSQMTRNVDPHEELLCILELGETRTAGMPLLIPPERESWQDEAADEEEPEYLTLFDMFCVLDEIKELSARPPINRDDEPIATDPGARYMQILAEWEDDKRKLSFYKEREKENRLVLFAGTFPNPIEGTQKFKLADGRTIKGQYKINRKIEEAALPVALAHMRELGVANTDALVSYKPTLAKREWNTLSIENKLAFSPAIVATPGTPTLDVELPKGSK